MPDTEESLEPEIQVVEDDAAGKAPVATDITRQKNEAENHYFRRAEPRPDAAPARERDKSRRIDDEGDEEYGPRVQRRINSFRRRAGDAESRAAALAEENKRLLAQVNEASTTALQHYEGAALARLDSAKRAAQEAYESGDGQKVVEANRQLASAQFAIDNVEAVKANRAKQPQPEPQAPQQQQRPRYSEKTQEWIEDNSWFDKDQDARTEAVRVHDRMVRQGYTPDTPEYFDELTRRCRVLFPEHFEGTEKEEEDEPPPRRKAQEQERAPARQTAPVSGVSRAVATPARRVNEVKLTKEQIEAAQIAGVTPAQYAKSLVRLRERSQ